MPIEKSVLNIASSSLLDIVCVKTSRRGDSWIDVDQTIQTKPSTVPSRCTKSSSADRCEMRASINPGVFIEMDIKMKAEPLSGE